MYAERSKQILTIILAVVTFAIVAMGAAFGMMAYGAEKAHSMDNHGILNIIEMNSACEAEVLKVEGDALKVESEADVQKVSVKTEAVNSKGCSFTNSAKADNVTVVTGEAQEVSEVEDQVIENEDYSMDVTEAVLSEDSEKDSLEEDSIRETEVEFN